MFQQIYWILRFLGNYIKFRGQSEFRKNYDKTVIRHISPAVMGLSPTSPAPRAASPLTLRCVGYIYKASLLY